MSSRRRAGDRVELWWPGKRDARGRRSPLPRTGAKLRALERHGPAAPWCDRLVLGDNLHSLEALARELEGKVDLVYMDPPFASGSDREVVRTVGEGGAVVRIPAYEDRWPGGLGEYLAMLDVRIRRIHRLLAPTGSLYVHVDATAGHAVKLLLDEVFGRDSFQREIVWRIGWTSGFKTRARNWIRNHDLIFFYTKDPRRFTFNKLWVPHAPGYRRRKGAPGPGIAIDDVWNAGEAEIALSGADSLDSIQIKSFSREKTGYATQKNESLLRRIVAASSNPGDLVLDPFCGSGTTLAVAAALGRRYVGCDSAPLAIALTRRRLLAQPRRGALVLAAAVASRRARAETGTLDVAIDGLDRGEIEPRLRGYAWPRPPAELAAALRRPLDGIDEWAVQWHADDGPFAPDEVIVRGGDGHLPDRCGPHRPRGRGPWRVRVRVYDVLGGLADAAWTLRRARDGRALVAS